MGWEDEHMYAFVIDGEDFGRSGEADYDSRFVRLSEVVEEGNTRFRYDYDFGDDWRHTIDIEKTLRVEEGVRYPRCVKGERACPPENCGGPYGYPYFLDKIEEEDALGFRGKLTLPWYETYVKADLEVELKEVLASAGPFQLGSPGAGLPGLRLHAGVALTGRAGPAGQRLEPSLVGYRAQDARHGYSSSSWDRRRSACGRSPCPVSPSCHGWWREQSEGFDPGLCPGPRDT